MPASSRPIHWQRHWQNCRHRCRCLPPHSMPGAIGVRLRVRCGLLDRCDRRHRGSVSSQAGAERSRRVDADPLTVTRSSTAGGPGARDRGPDLTGGADDTSIAPSPARSGRHRRAAIHATSVIRCWIGRGAKAEHANATDLDPVKSRRLVSVGGIRSAHRADGEAVRSRAALDIGGRGRHEVIVTRLA